MASTYLDERTYSPGDVIVREGDTGNEMFILQEGKVVVTKDIDGHDVFLALLERGDFFGEMALLDSQPRNATCSALVPTRVAVIRSGELLIKLRRDPTFALEMLQALSRRIRYLDTMLAEFVREDVPSKATLDKLIAKGEYAADRER